MAFPIPSHLPRRGVPQDISSQILTKVSSATTKTLTADFATSWIAELDETILQTKSRIHERLNADLPAFHHLLSTSKSVQHRLQTLTDNVDTLSDAVSHPESGLIPTLVSALSAHAKLAQQTLDAEVLHESLSHLLRCCTEFDALNGLVNEGRLPEAVQSLEGLDRVLSGAPVALAQSEAMADMKRQFRAVKDRVEEQLSDAYNRGIVISAHKIIVRPTIQVRQSSATLTLSSIMSSLAPASLASHLATLRRDLTTHYLQFIVSQPASVSFTTGKDATGTAEHTLTLYPSPPNTEDRAQRLRNLASVFDFLQHEIFSALPASQAASFKQSLCKPLTTALLQHFLIPLLPSSLNALPAFIDLVQQAVGLEGKYVIDMLGQDTRDREVQAWADGIATHYERKRRAEMLEQAREVINKDDEGGRIHVEVILEETSNAVPEVVPEQPEEQESAWGFEEEQVATGSSNEETTKVGEEDGWGFEEPTEDQDGWGFDDEPTEPEPEPEPAPQPSLPPAPEREASQEEDPADAWGWNEGDEPIDDEGNEASTSPETDSSSTWDDPWADADSAPAPDRPPTSPLAPFTKSETAPKRATRLEKLANKGKPKHTPQTSIESALAVNPPPPTPIVTRKPESSRPPRITVPVNNKPKVVQVKETYAVSARARDVAGAVEDVLHEGAQFVAAAPSIFAGVVEHQHQHTRQRGTVLLQSAPAVLDLFRALYPVRFARALSDSVDRAVVFSNDCAYLSECAARLARGEREEDVRSKLVEAGERLDVLGTSWFEDSLERQKVAVLETLGEAEGFVETGDQDRFDECEGAVTSALGQIRRVAKQWKGVMRKSKYYAVAGVLVDAALATILDDILALPDITEVESHRLSELCRIMNAIEGIFMEDPDQPSLVVAYVPSWLKFSYLSEILEASLADVSYLFDEGALVDFEMQELVKLVRALFADTPQRTSLVNKLMGGHLQAR